MSVLDNLQGLRKSILGARVERADASLPQTTAEALFTVSGGKVLITGIVGEVGTVIETQANNTKLTANPTTGTSVDICAVLNISADEAGTLYSITGTLSDALVGTTAGAVAAQAKGVIVNAGTIDLDCAASNTGTVAWTIFYTPIDDGAAIEAA
jgi:hypothetical protein